LDVVFRSYDITRDFTNVYTNRELDCVIRPNIGSYHWSDFKCLDLSIQEGYQAAKARAPEIRRRIFWFGG
ncbi:MAG: hypothetical protein WDA72_10335, partial [Desulfomonilia bacterium]